VGFSGTKQSALADRQIVSKWFRNIRMALKDTPAERLLHEAKELREAAIDLMEHAILLMSKSLEIDNEIKKNQRLSGDGNLS
jgi:hypothetical protein